MPIAVITFAFLVITAAKVMQADITPEVINGDMQINIMFNKKKKGVKNMSLIIATVVKDGIVVAADTRTTCKDGNGNCRYSDTAEKLIPFPNKVVVFLTRLSPRILNAKVSGWINLGKLK